MKKKIFPESSFPDLSFECTEITLEGSYESQRSQYYYFCITSFRYTLSNYPKNHSAIELIPRKSSSTHELWQGFNTEVA